MSYKKLLIKLLPKFLLLTDINSQEIRYIKTNIINNLLTNVVINNNSLSIQCNNLFKLNNLNIKLNIYNNYNNIPVYINTIYKLSNNLSIVIDRGLSHRFSNFVIRYSSLINSFCLQLGFTLCEGFHLWILNGTDIIDINNYTEKIINSIINEIDSNKIELEKNKNISEIVNELLQKNNDKNTDIEDPYIEDPYSKDQNIMDTSSEDTYIDDRGGRDTFSEDAYIEDTYIEDTFSEDTNKTDVFYISNDQFYLNEEVYLNVEFINESFLIASKYYNKLLIFFSKYIFDVIDGPINQLYVPVKFTKKSKQPIVKVFKQTVNQFFSDLRKIVLTREFYLELMKIMSQHIYEKKINVNNYLVKLDPGQRRLTQEYIRFIELSNEKDQETLQNLLKYYENQIINTKTVLKPYIIRFFFKLHEYILSVFEKNKAPLDISLNLLIQNYSEEIQKEDVMMLQPYILNLYNDLEFSMVKILKKREKDFLLKSGFIKKLQKIVGNFTTEFKEDIDLILNLNLFNKSYSDLYICELIIPIIQFTYKIEIIIKELNKYSDKLIMECLNKAIKLTIEKILIIYSQKIEHFPFEMLCDMRNLITYIHKQLLLPLSINETS